MYAINTSKHILSARNLKLHYSLMNAHLIYGIQLWGNAYNKYIGKLEIAKSENCSNGIRSSVIPIKLF